MRNTYLCVVFENHFTQTLLEIGLILFFKGRFVAVFYCILYPLIHLDQT